MVGVEEHGQCQRNEPEAEQKIADSLRLVQGREDIAACANSLGDKPDTEGGGGKAPEGASQSLRAETGVSARRNHHAAHNQLHEVRQGRARRRSPKHGYGSGMHQQQNGGDGQYGGFTAQC